MSIKALVEKKNALVVEAEKMLNVAVEEVRALNEEEKTAYETKEAEIRELEETIKLMEKRSKETKVEEVVSVEERKEEEKVETKETIVEQEKRALADYMRGNITEEVRAMTTTNNGTALIPTHLYNEVIEELAEVAPLYSMVPKLTPVNGNLEILRETGIGTGAFVGEATNLTLTDFTMDKVKLEQKRAGSAIEISQQLINDSGIDIVGYTKNLLYKRLGYALDRAIISGTTVGNSFEGLDSIAGGTDVNQIEEIDIKTDATITISDFMNVLNAMHPDHQAGAVWIMSRKLFNIVAQLQDAAGNYYMLRQMNVVTNKPEYSLFGCKILINDAVKDVADTNRIAYLVNFNEAFKGMIKKDMELKQISGDTQNALKGSHTFTLDIYTDVKCVQPKAVKALKHKN